MAKLDYADCKTLIDRMVKRFSGDGKLWDVCTVREQHYYQTSEANPPMIAGYESHSRQTSILRDTHIKYRARATENQWRAQYKAPRKSAALDQKASDCEAATIQGFSEMESNTGQDLQGFMADGQGIYCYGVLHAYLADGEINSAGAAIEYEELDELPTDPKEASRYVEGDDAEESGKAKKYRETDDSVMARRNAARAGWPWWAEVFRPQQFAFVRDRSLIGEFKYGLTLQVIPLIDLIEARENVKAGDLTERAAPIDLLDAGSMDKWRPSSDTEETLVKVYRLWSREWIYEICDGLPAEKEDQRYRCIKNRVKIVPFWLAPGMLTNSEDPVFAYEPILASVYRFKPVYDRYMSNMEALAESAAIPRYWLVPLSDKVLPPLADEEGHIKVFSLNSMEATKAPEGYRFERIGGDGATGQYERLGEWYRQELLSILPDTGVGDIKDSTSPWTAQILQRIGNIVPGMGVDHLQNAFLGMVRMITRVNADEDDGPGTISFYHKDNGEALVTLEPSDWGQLQVDVEINKVSSVERATQMQIATELVKGGHWTELDFIEKGEGEPDPQRVFANREVIKYWQANILPGQLRKAFAEVAGSEFALLPSSTQGAPPFVDMTGKAVNPQEVLQANGQQAQGQQPQQAQIASVAGSQPTMGTMPSLAVPGQGITPGVR